MSRRKTTVYLDSDVLTATKVIAAARQQSESRVIEDALRSFLGNGELNAAKSELRALMDRLARRTGLDEEDAMALAVEEVHALRTTHVSRRRSA